MEVFLCQEISSDKSEIEAFVNEAMGEDSLSLSQDMQQGSFQKKVLGGKLISESHQTLRELSFRSIMILGHENYSHRFAYQDASQCRIQLLCETNDRKRCAQALEKNRLEGVRDVVVYAKTFFEKIDDTKSYIF